VAPNTFQLHNTSAEAIANTAPISSSGGSGAHTLNLGSIFSFTGAFKNAKITGQVADILKISAQVKVTGLPTIT
jgi:hypothetical protein